MILSVLDYKDIKKIEKKEPKYINISITNPDIKIINYFMKNGSKYSFSENINDKRGYIYVDYSIFYRAQLIVNNIVFNMDENLTELEKARYLYIKIGSIIGCDINAIPSKNDKFNFRNISTINNIWGALYNERCTNISIVKLYLYLCSLLNIKCDIVMTNDDGYLCNKLVIDNKSIIVDLTKDIPFIQGHFKTKYFDGYNENATIDRKIGYIKRKYSDELLTEALNNVDYTNIDVLKVMLMKTQDIIDVANIKPTELGIIFRSVFDKYCPNYEIIISNLFYVDNVKRNHFLLFSYGEQHYSFNYTKNTFIKISIDSINKSINENRIGLYLEEEIPNLNNKVIC